MTETQSWFDSPYYYQLYSQLDAKVAASFIDKLIDYLKPKPGASMLDIACGKGDHSLALASKGFDVTGIDFSEHNIAAATRNEGENLHFFVHDIRLPFWINYFDYAFNLFARFGYFKTRREHENEIRTIAQSLKQGGIFIIDYINVHFEEDHLVFQTENKIGDVNYVITKWLDETAFYKKVIVEDDHLEEPLEFKEKLARFTLGDFVDMLSFQEMQVQEVFGDYNFSEYDIKKSPRLIIIARKVMHQE